MGESSTGNKVSHGSEVYAQFGSDDQPKSQWVGIQHDWHIPTVRRGGVRGKLIT